MDMYNNESFDENGPGGTAFWDEASLFDTKRKLDFMISCNVPSLRLCLIGIVIIIIMYNENDAV